MLSRCTQVACAVLFGLLAVSTMDANAHSVTSTEVAANETKQQKSPETKNVPFSDVDKGPREDMTDVYAVPLDTDEADEDLEIEDLERRAANRKK